MIFLQEVWEKPNLKTVLAMSVMTAAEVTAQTGSEWLVLPLFFFFFHWTLVCLFLQCLDKVIKRHLPVVVQTDTKQRNPTEVRKSKRQQSPRVNGTTMMQRWNPGLP